MPGMRFRTALALGVLPALLACGRGKDLTSPDPERRVRAVLDAGRRGAEGTAALLVAQRDPDARVRRAAAESFSGREGPAAVDALAVALTDADPEVVAIAARGLAARPSAPRTRGALVAAYAGASPEGRAVIAEALGTLGTSLREAVELEARGLWERNASALGAPGPARAGAAEELGASGRVDAVQRLLPLVDPGRNGDRALLMAAARGLGEAGDRAARKPLEALVAGGDAELAEVAADALGRLGDPASADVLAAAAMQGGGRVAAAALDALAALPQAPEVGTALCEVGLKSPDPKLAERAARAARERDAACPYKPLLARLGRPGTAAALAALPELRPPEAEVVPRILPLLDPARTPDLGVRLAALRALGRLRAQTAAAAVKSRVAALQARVEAGRARWIRGRLSATPLAGIDAKGDGRLAAVLARAAGPAPGADAEEPALAGWVRPPAGDGLELGAALAAAGELRVPEADKVLGALAGDPDPAVRAGVMEGMGALGGDRAVEVAGTAVGDPDPRVQAAAAGALRRLGPKGVAALIRALGAPQLEPGRCAVLARALGEAGMAEAVPALAGRLGGPCGAEAADALARIASPTASAPLVAALGRPGGTGRVEMIEALAAVGGPTAGEALTRELTSDRPQCRAAAARALASLRHEQAAERLEALRSDYYGLVRRAAVEALAKLPVGPARPR
jgi:HEAT repeat protein